MDIKINTERTDDFTLAVRHEGATVGWVHAVPGGLNKYMGQRRPAVAYTEATRIFETEGEAVQWVYAPHAEPPRNAFMEILSAVPHDEPDTSLDVPAEPALRVEPCVLSNEILYQQDGGEPIVYAVLGRDDTLMSVWLTETEAQDWIAFGAH